MQFYEITLAQWIGLLLAAVAGHVGVLAAARKAGILFVLTAVLLVLSPFSAAPELGSLGILIRWVRAYALILLIVVGLFKYRRGTLRPASIVGLLFLGAFALTGVYGEKPAAALMYKAQLFLMAVGAMLVAFSVRDRQELIRGLRCLEIAAGLLALAALASIMRNPAGFVNVGRVNILGVLPTRIAGDLAVMLFFCTYLALNERVRSWRVIAYSACGALAMVIALTGSRGPAAIVVMVFLVQLMPQSGRRLRKLLLPAFVVGLGFLVLQVVGNEVAIERLVSTTDTRTEVWGRSWQAIQAKPVIGYGWLHVPAPGGGQRVFNAHNVVLQVATEGGAIGLALLAGSTLIVGLLTVSTYLFLRQQRSFADLAILPISLVAAGLLDGIVTSSAVIPSSTAFVMALGVALADRLPELASIERQRAWRAMAYLYARRAWLPGKGLPRPGTA